jgi:2-polyprenyl-6-methoxyphenol hydroxylase-like FAD-dependent oxidoreductase
MTVSTERLHCDVLIVGAGIAGSAAACALRDRGLRIVQVEMSNRPLDTARGDHLQCAVVDILDRWRALPALWAAGAEKRHGARYVTERGATILEIDYARLAIPHPYYLYLHHELLASTFLALAAENSDYRLLRGARAREFETGPGGIRSLTLQRAGERIVVEPRLVIGADGRSSRVRQVLGFEATEHLYEHPIVLHLAPRRPGDSDSRNELTTFLGAAGSASRIPRAFGGWKIGTTIASSAIGFWKSASLAERRAAFAAIAPPLEPLEFEFAGFYHVKLLNTHRWVRGNTVLVGDACHAMHPARGQGMNVALRCLAELIESLPPVDEFDSPDVLADSLSRYEARVKPTIDPVLGENHAHGAAGDSLEPERRRQLIDRLTAIQDDAARLSGYIRAAAGYPAAV